MYVYFSYFKFVARQSVGFDGAPESVKHKESAVQYYTESHVTF